MPPSAYGSSSSVDRSAEYMVSFTSSFMSTKIVEVWNVRVKSTNV